MMSIRLNLQLFAKFLAATRCDAEPGRIAEAVGAQVNTPAAEILKPSFTQSLVKTVKDLLGMNTWIGTYRRLVGKLLQIWPQLRACTSGNVLLLSAVAMPVLVGMAGLAIEGGNWYQTKRAMQNAADSAAIAARRLQPN